MNSFRKQLSEAIDGLELSPCVGSLLGRYALTLGDIEGRSRLPHIVRTRHAIWGLLVDGGYSMAAVGRMAGRDHTTVMSAMRKRGVVS